MSEIYGLWVAQSLLLHTVAHQPVTASLATCIYYSRRSATIEDTREAASVMVGRRPLGMQVARLALTAGVSLHKPL